MFAGKRLVALTIVMTLLVSGCATTRGSSASDDGKCVGAAVGGALAGALLGALLSKNKVSGAAIGAAGGGLLAGGLCLAVTSESRQTKTAAEVEMQFKSANKGSLPAEPVVQEYTTTIVPTSGVLQKGEDLVIQSQAQVVRGRVSAVNSVTENVQLKLGDDVLQKFSKELPSSGGGGYETVHTVHIPPRFQDGTYTVTSNLMVNGKLASTRLESFRVVTRDDGVRFALLEVR
jgi:hypothetical protein